MNGTRYVCPVRPGEWAPCSPARESEQQLCHARGVWAKGAQVTLTDKCVGDKLARVLTDFHSLAPRIWPLRSATLATVALVAVVFSLPPAGPFAAASTASSQAPAPVRIVLVGDSTVTDESGWGLGFRKFAADGVEVINAAASGRSSRSFIDEGRWTEALAKKGQYYLVQFGHNDEPGKGPARETDPGTTYREHMARYVDEARAVGATPVLVTSLVRRHYNDDGTIRTTQTPYVEAVRALAADKRVPLIDLHAITTADAEHAGDDVWADLSPRDGNGQVDRTHLNPKGSEVVGRFVVDELRKVVPALARMVKLDPIGQDLFEAALRGTEASGLLSLP